MLFAVSTNWTEGLESGHRKGPLLLFTFHSCLPGTLWLRGIACPRLVAPIPCVRERAPCGDTAHPLALCGLSLHSTEEKSVTPDGAQAGPRVPSLSRSLPCPSLLQGCLFLQQLRHLFLSASFWTSASRLGYTLKPPSTPIQMFGLGPAQKSERERSLGMHTTDTVSSPCGDCTPTFLPRPCYVYNAAATGRLIACSSLLLNYLWRP